MRIIRKRTDEMITVVGRFQREYAWVHDWGYSPGGKGAELKQTRGGGSRQAIQWQDQTGDVASSKAKAYARGQAKLAAEALQRSLAELRAGLAILEDAMGERLRWDQASEAAAEQRRQYPGTVTPDELTKLHDAQRARDRRGDGIPA